MAKSIIIGLTGGIGSGKTTATRIASALGVPVYIADNEAKALYVNDPKLKAEVIKHFGKEVYLEGKLNRSYLSQLVFNSPQKLDLLNSLVHPAVAAHFEAWKKAHSSYPMVIKEAAILFESGSYKDCDCTITINCNEDERIRRVKLRDNISESEIRKRLSRQLTDDQRTKKADYHLVNDGNQLLYFQVVNILKTIKRRFCDSSQSHQVS